MRATLKPGLRHCEQLQVDELLTGRAASSGHLDTLPPVFATAFMVAFIESACVIALRPFLDANERTVGTHIDVSHKAPATSRAGRIVSLDVELVALDARRLRFAVLCRDALDVIATGTHERVVIDLPTYLSRGSREQTISMSVSARWRGNA